MHRQMEPTPAILVRITRERGMHLWQQTPHNLSCSTPGLQAGAITSLQLGQPSPTCRSRTHPIICPPSASQPLPSRRPTLPGLPLRQGRILCDVDRVPQAQRFDALILCCC